MSNLKLSGIPAFKIKLTERGRVRDIKKIIVRIDGLPSCLNGQIVTMGGTKGIVMGFDADDVLALVLGDDSRIRMGQEVSAISEPFTIPVGSGCIGRMVTALGQPMDGKAEIEAEEHVPVFAQSTPITQRAPVDEFLNSGTKVIDFMVPLGKGQRQLIVGDRMTGKTVIALDAIINQKGKNVVCIYCYIGKSVSSLEKVIAVLGEKGSLDYCVIVVAADNASAGEQYIVPFSAASIAEFFARKGRDVLVVFDDLTKHAWAYRQLSLLLERPPGREAYPGDIFYVQTQLMERAGRFNKASGGGSITFLGIAETLQGDLTGYIPSNLISMSDGMVVLSSTIFAEGKRPAVDLGVSLSIVGGKAQVPVLRTLSSRLRLEYQEYSELLKLSALQSGLSQAAQKVMKRGEAIMASLQQQQYQPVCLEEGVLVLFALRKGALDDMTPERRNKFLHEIMNFAREKNAGLLAEIGKRKELTKEIEGGLDCLIGEYLAAQ